MLNIGFKYIFRKYAGQNPYFVFLALLLLVQFFAYKIYYPYPNFLPDSYSYISAADKGLSINIWPIGYSEFLKFIHFFSKSDTLLNLIQYLFLQASLLYLLYSIYLIYNPGKWTMRVLTLCSIANPLLFHISNFISSDAIFCALSLVWFTQLLWILYRPKSGLLISHAFVLLFLFSIRYNALYYPLISIAVLSFSKLPAKYKIINIFLISSMISFFCLKTIHDYTRLTGTRQFSAFGGWQLSSNALIACTYLSPEIADSVPEQFKALDIIVKKNRDSLRTVNTSASFPLDYYYLWDARSPLKTYMKEYWRNNHRIESFAKWADMGPLYQKYGSFLIQKHPKTFFKYYIFPNIIRYYVPPVEFLGWYNMGKDTVENVAQKWFGYSSNKIISKTSNKQISILNPFPIFTGTLNLLFIMSAISFKILGEFKKTSKEFKTSFKLMIVTWISNLGFSVLASPVVLRYQIFPILITFIFTWIMISFLGLEARKKQAHQSLETLPA